MDLISFTTVFIFIIGIMAGLLISNLIQKMPLFLTKRHIISQAKQIALSRSSTDGFIIFNSSGNITHANQALLSIFDYQSEQLIGQNIAILIAPTETECLNHKLNNTSTLALAHFSALTDNWPR